MGDSVRPAFPSSHDHRQFPEFTGLTKRELVAAMVLQGLLSGRRDSLGTNSENRWANQAVRLADALLVALEGASK